jgi:hypothetical protein
MLLAEPSPAESEPVASEPPKPVVEPRAIRTEVVPPLREPSKTVVAPIAAGPPSSEPPKARMLLAEPSPAESEAVASEPSKPVVDPRAIRTEAVPPLREPSKTIVAPIAVGPPSSEPPKAPTLLAQPNPADNERVAADQSEPASRPMKLRIEHVSAKFLPRWRIRH